MAAGVGYLIDPKDRVAAPAWGLQDFNGGRVESSSYAGKVVVLDFWATWCPPCRQEIPGFVELQSKYGDKGVVIVGVDVGPEPAAVVQRFMEQMKVNYPVLAGSTELDQAFGGIEAIPTTFLIDRKGRIASKHVGFTPQSTFEKEIELLLAEPL